MAKKLPKYTLEEAMTELDTLSRTIASNMNAAIGYYYDRHPDQIDSIKIPNLSELARILTEELAGDPDIKLYSTEEEDLLEAPHRPGESASFLDDDPDELPKAKVDRDRLARSEPDEDEAVGPDVF